MTEQLDLTMPINSRTKELSYSSGGDITSEESRSDKNGSVKNECDNDLDVDREQCNNCDEIEDDVNSAYDEENIPHILIELPDNVCFF